GERVVLLPGCDHACTNKREGLHYRLRTQLGEPLGAIAAGFARAEWRARHARNRSGRQLRYHLHNGDATRPMPLSDSQLNRRSAAELGKQCCVDVPRAHGRQVDHRLRQDVPVGYYNGDIRLQRRALLHELRSTRAFGLQHRNAFLLGNTLYRAGLQGGTRATARAVWLGNDSCHVKAFAEQGQQRWCRKFGGAPENDTHRRQVLAWSFRVRRRRGELLCPWETACGEGQGTATSYGPTWQGSSCA